MSTSASLSMRMICSGVYRFLDMGLPPSFFTTNPNLRSGIAFGGKATARTAIAEPSDVLDAYEFLYHGRAILPPRPLPGTIRFCEIS